MILKIWKEKNLIWKLAKNDFKTKYAGSYLGVIWGFIQPIVTVLVYWIVFEYGLRVGTPIPDVPYILWFIAGMVPWLFFAEALTNSTNSLLEYNYLVKKVVFNVSILPIVKIISALFVHLVFIIFTCIIYLLYNRIFSIHYLELVYYLIAMNVLVIGISYFTSALQVFVKDLSQFINILLQIFMWATPILWDYNIVSEKYLWIIKLNPMFYIVQGYRISFLGTSSLENGLIQTIYFWTVTILMLLVGIKSFKRLQPHFADII